MKDAGLEPSPQIESTLNVGRGPEGHLFPYLVDLVRSAMDSIIASGAATAEEIDIDTSSRDWWLMRRSVASSERSARVYSALSLESPSRGPLLIVKRRICNWAGSVHA